MATCKEGYYWNSVSKTCRPTGRTRKKMAEEKARKTKKRMLGNKKKNTGENFKGAYGGN